MHGFDYKARFGSTAIEQRDRQPNKTHESMRELPVLLTKLCDINLCRRHYNYDFTLRCLCARSVGPAMRVRVHALHQVLRLSRRVLAAVVRVGAQLGWETQPAVC